MNSSLLQTGASNISFLYVLMTVSTLNPRMVLGVARVPAFLIIEMLYYANRCLLWLLSLLSLNSFPNCTFSVYRDWKIVICWNAYKLMKTPIMKGRRSLDKTWIALFTTGFEQGQSQKNGWTAKIILKTYRRDKTRAITSTQMSLSLIYGVLINVDLFSVLGHVFQVGHQEKCLRLTTQLKWRCLIKKKYFRSLI